MSRSTESLPGPAPYTRAHTSNIQSLTPREMQNSGEEERRPHPHLTPHKWASAWELAKNVRG